MRAGIYIEVGNTMKIIRSLLVWEYIRELSNLADRNEIILPYISKNRIIVGFIQKARVCSRNVKNTVPE